LASVSDRNDLGVGESGQVVPGVLELVDLGHVGHAAAGGEVRQGDDHVVGGQDVGGLSHEVNAAEDDELGILLFGPVRSANWTTLSRW